MAGFAPNATVFILGRALTGAGAGGLFTTTNVLLIEGAPIHRRGLLLGIVNCVVTCGSSLGGVIGGALAASSYGWVSHLSLFLHFGLGYRNTNPAVFAATSLHNASSHSSCLRFRSIRMLSDSSTACFEAKQKAKVGKN